MADDDAPERRKELSSLADQRIAREQMIRELGPEEALRQLGVTVQPHRPKRRQKEQGPPPHYFWQRIRDVHATLLGGLNMTESLKITLIVGAFVLALGLLFGRYEIVPVSGVGQAYVLDRLTGQIERCFGARCIVMSIVPPPASLPPR